VAEGATRPQVGDAGPQEVPTDLAAASLADFGDDVGCTGSQHTIDPAPDVGTVGRGLVMRSRDPGGSAKDAAQEKSGQCCATCR
jgi:hypothetical protein